MSQLYDSVPDSVRESIYNAVEDCVRRGVSLSDLKRVIAQAWTDVHRERLSIAEKDATAFLSK